MPGPDRRARVPLLDAALLLVLLEAAVLVGIAGWWIVVLVTGGSEAVGVGLFLALFALGVAAVLVAAARALRRGARRARGPVLTWQLLQAATAVTVIQTSPVWAGLALAVALAVVALLLTRPVVRHTVGWAET